MNEDNNNVIPTNSNQVQDSNNPSIIPTDGQLLSSGVVPSLKGETSNQAVLPIQPVITNESPINDNINKSEQVNLITPQPIVNNTSTANQEVSVNNNIPQANIVNSQPIENSSLTDINNLNSNKTSDNVVSNTNNIINNSGNNNGQNNGEKANHYAEYLPQNRRNETPGLGLSPMVAKVAAGLFVIFAAISIGYMVTTSKDGQLLKTESRYYNLNLKEGIKLDTISKEENITWESNSENVVIENNTITAVNPGSAYIIGVVDDKQVTDLTVTVLEEGKQMYLENHSIEVGMGEKSKIKVNKKVSKKTKTTSKNPKKKSSKKERRENYNLDGEEDLDEFYDSDDFEFDDFFDEDFLEDDDFFDDDFYEDDFYEDDDGGFDDFEDEEFEEFDDQRNPYFDDMEDDSLVIEEDSIDFNNEEEDVYVTDDDFNYESSDEDIALVDDDGNIIPVSEGTVVVTVTDSDGNQDHTYVTITEDDLNVKKNEINLKIDESANIEFSVNEDKYKKEDVTFSSDNEGVAIVDGSGNVSAISSGVANISVKLDSISKNVKIVVSESTVLPSNLILSDSDITLTSGDSKKITFEVEPDNVTDRGIVWKSANDTIASVDSDGVIRANNAGDTVITATTSNNIVKEVKVKVEKRIIEVTDIKLDKTNIKMKVGENAKINYSIIPSNATDKTVAFEYDTNYISVDNKGNITAIKAGVTDLKIKTNNDHSAAVRIEITSKEKVVNEIKINEGDLKITQGASKKLTITANPSDVDISKVTWSSSDSNIVSIDSNGVLSAKGLGSATIRASLSDKTASISVVVESDVVRVTNVSVNENKVQLKAGKTYKKLKVEVFPNSATNKNVIWKSSNSKVASVDQSGKITAHSKGKATITVTSSENSAMYQNIEVTVTYDVSLVLEYSSKSISVGNSFTLKAKVLPAEVNQKIKWSSNNKKVATVDQNGKITAVAAGTATITAESVEDSSKKQNCKVIVKDKYTVIINPSHQPTNSTVSSNAKFNTEMKSMFVLGRALEKKLVDDDYNVVITPDKGSIDSGDNCWQIDDWSKCGRKYVKYAVEKGKANTDSKNVYIALHSNAVGGKNSSVTGPVIFHSYRYNSSKSVDFAKELCKNIISVYDKNNFTTTFNTVDKCVSRSKNVGEPSMYFDYNGKGAAVLIEIGFHDHVKNQQFIEKNIDSLASAMKKAIEEYIKTH